MMMMMAMARYDKLIIYGLIRYDERKDSGVDGEDAL